MLTVPTSADIRAARARTARVWSVSWPLISGPALAGLGATATGLHLLITPLTPALDRAGMSALTSLLNIVILPSHTIFPSTPSDTHHRANGTTQLRPPCPTPAPLRAGLYAELAWRGRQLLHRVHTLPAMTALRHRARAITESANTTIEDWADELHDSTEEVLGALILGTHQARDRIASALLAGAYALRAATAAAGDHR